MPFDFVQLDVPDIVLVEPTVFDDARGIFLERYRSSALRDVAVDVRRESPWHGRHVAVDLTGDNHRLLWIPPGFAHGLCALEEDTEVLYLQTGEYEPDAERGIHPLDPALGIEWPFLAGELALP